MINGSRSLIALMVAVAAIVGVAADDTSPGTRTPSAIGSAPPAWLKNHRFADGSFTFVRIEYPTSMPGRRTWATDYPDADINLSGRLADWTSLEVDRKGKVLSFTSPELSKHTFAYLCEGGRMHLTDSQVAAARRYLQNGGFLLIDDVWGDAEWKNLAHELQRILPESTPRELPLEHPVFHCVFDFKQKPQVCSIGAAYAGRDKGITYERADGKHVRYMAVENKSGRTLILVGHNTDLGDGWERMDDDEWYSREFSEKRAFPMAMNIVFHALTQTRDR